MKATDLNKSIAELMANPPLRSGYPCRIQRILAELSDEDGRALIELIDNSKISASAIARLLNEHGHDVKDATIGKHRRRNDGTGCRCPKKVDA